MSSRTLLGCPIEAHEDDVNAVAFADNSSHIVFSGGDDAICKVWDRRTMREDDPQPGDARYLISNSKDQTIKLWDMRKFSGQEGLEASRHAVTQQIWDYRWQQVPKKVLHTLIRCRFSPPHSTGQQYIYSGCSTGRVVVYDLLSGLIVKKLVNHQACVRDVSWHPYEEKIVSSSWDGNVCLWEYHQTEHGEDDLGDPQQLLTAREKHPQLAVPPHQ
ncbi:DDB1- and CUL4-associated factor 11, partial [Ophiophagus hannah]